MAIITPGQALPALQRQAAAIPFWGNQTAPAADGPVYMTNPWDYAVFNGRQLPGKWTCKGTPTLAIDKKKHAGVDGAAITVQGYIPGPVDIEGLLWLPDQWKAMQEVAPQIWRKPAKKSALSDLAVTIEHPGLAIWGIAKFVVIGVGPPEDGPVRQSKIIRIKGIEYVPIDSKKQTHTAKSAPQAPLAKQLQPAKNSPLNAPPDETDTTIHGKKPDPRGGAE